jgi:hypothetical protein
LVIDPAAPLTYAPIAWPAMKASAFVVELLDWEDDWHGPTLYLMSGPRPDPAV